MQVAGTFLLKQRLAKSGIASPLGGEDRKFKSCSADNSVLVSMVAYLKILTLCWPWDGYGSSP